MKTVLFIEDNLQIRENTVELLELAGYRVLTAENGRNVLSLVKDQKPDIILCDILMPEVTGYEVFRELKGDESAASIPFVFVTASAEKSQVQAGLNMGAVGYIRKPFTEEELLQTIEKCLM